MITGSSVRAGAGCACGVPATAADLRQYDVTTFDKNTNILYVSDLRLTGVYENASPSSPLIRPT